VISFGDLAGKTIPANVEGPIVQGRSGARVFRAPSYFLSDAARDALKGSRFDTLVDVEVTTRTGLAVPSNQIEVRGKALDSHTLQ
jgi:hypothetical protein